MHLNSTKDTGETNAIKQKADVASFVNYENTELKVVKWFSKVCYSV